MKIEGLEQLQKDLEDAQRAMNDLAGDIAELEIDPNDQASIDAALRQMDRAIDERTTQYRGNPLVEPLVVHSKQVFREAILKRVAEAKA